MAENLLSYKFENTIFYIQRIVPGRLIGRLLLAKRPIM